MTYDVVCAGAVTLDLTFAGVDALPRPGEERWATDLQVTPGGMANIAVGLRRLGLKTAIACALGRDLPGRYLRAMLKVEGIALEGPRVAQSAMTAVVPIHGDRAMVSFEPADAFHAPRFARLPTRAVVALIDQIDMGPPGTPVYAVTSHAACVTGLRELAWAHAIVANEQEALAISGATDAEEAAWRLSAQAGTAVVTLGERGALAVSGSNIVRVSAPEVEVRDATGAGDLFAAAYVWTDLVGLGLRERLRWATLYASLSLRTVTAFAGAVHLDDLIAAGQGFGLARPESG
jgi:ribokinase